MSDLPDDLIQIQRDLFAARAAADAHAAEMGKVRLPVDAGYAQILERQAQLAPQEAELDRLRAEYKAAFEAKWEHPLAVQAREDRTFKQLDLELREAALKAAEAN